MSLPFLLPVPLSDNINIYSAEQVSIETLQRLKKKKTTFKMANTVSPTV